MSLERILDARVVLVYGKGGVGKTTFSLLAGLYASGRGRRVLIVSMDPAKHLPGYAGCDCINKPVTIDGLTLEQYDPVDDVRRLGEEYALLLKRISSRLSVINLDSLVSVVRDAPGLEEEAYLRRLESIYARMDDYDLIIVDMPPTGVALRIVRLPRLYSVWLGVLEEVRAKLLETRMMIARVAGGDVTDPVLGKLRELRERFERLERLVLDEGVTLHVGVATPEPLPVMEVEQVSASLGELGGRLGLIVLNRVLSRVDAERLGVVEQQEEARRRLSRLAPLVEIPYLGRPTRSLSDVKELLGRVAGV